MTNVATADAEKWSSRMKPMMPALVWTSFWTLMLSVDVVSSLKHGEPVFTVGICIAFGVSWVVSMALIGVGVRDLLR
jgi:hypothetical protein